MITIKTAEELEVMREGGKITAAVLKKVLEAARPGIALSELEKLANDEILSRGGEPAFKRVRDYGFATCLNINEGVVHGLPTDRKLVGGELLSVDLGTFYKGFNTDSSWMMYIGDQKKMSKSKIEFLKVGQKALRRAITQTKVGKQVMDISRAMQKVIEQGGYSPVDSLVGHGIGRKLHEDPEVPCLVLRNRSPELAAGMTLAIEVIYTKGSPRLRIEEDGWTASTSDGSLSGLFEHTVAVTDEGPIILTKRN